jgi:hypothetical protein
MHKNLSGTPAGCRMVFGDQTSGASMYQVTVVHLASSGTQWAITIDRLL